MNEDRDALIYYSFCDGMKKARIAYLFHLTVRRVSRIIAEQRRARMEPLDDIIFRIAPINNPFVIRPPTDWQS